MLDLTTKKAKQFFFDRAEIMRRVAKSRKKNLVTAGMLIRTVARRSMRPARRMRIAELDSEARQRHHIQVALAEREGRFKPKLPYASSKPGEPPRRRSGLIHQLLFAIFDESTKSVVIGPIGKRKLGKDSVPERIEYGDSDLAARPFMSPAFEKTKAKYVHLWKDSIV